MKLLYDYEHEDDILHLEDNIFKPRIFPETMEGNLKKISLFFLVALFSFIFHKFSYYYYINYAEITDSIEKAIVFLGMIISIYVIFPLHYPIYKKAVFLFFNKKKVREYIYSKYLLTVDINKLESILSNNKSNFSKHNIQVIKKFLIMYYHSKGLYSS